MTFWGNSKYKRATRPSDEDRARRKAIVQELLRKYGLDNEANENERLLIEFGWES